MRARMYGGAVSKTEFTLKDCPTPYPPWMAGTELPRISLTIPLEAGEDLTGATVRLLLTRDTSGPTDDILEKTLTEVENLVGKHATFRVDWIATDLIEGKGQRALFVLTTVGGDEEPIARFKIDVFENPDPTP